jgi:hypothetical protein
LELRIAKTWDGFPLAEADQVVVRLDWESGDLRIRVDAPFYDDPAPTQAPGPTWALWEHEVVEVFLLGPDDNYTEIELGPHGHHLVLRLAGCRNLVARELPLDLQIERDRDRWRGIARVSAEHLPHPIQRLNAYAIHGAGMQRIYAAWAPVPGPEPDFHRLKCFPEVVLGSE